MYGVLTKGILYTPSAHFHGSVGNLAAHSAEARPEMLASAKIS